MSIFLWLFFLSLVVIFIKVLDAISREQYNAMINAALNSDIMSITTTVTVMSTAVAAA